MRNTIYLFTILSILLIPVMMSNGVDNLLENGDFEADTVEPWTTYGDAEISLNTDDSASGDQCLYVEVTSVGANFWDSGLQHAGHVFEPGTYTLSAFLKGEEERQINFKPELGEGPWTGYGEKEVTMTTEWAEYHTTAEIPEVVDPGTITFHIAYSDINFLIDNVMWYEGEYVPSVTPTAVQPSDKLATSWADIKNR